MCRPREEGNPITPDPPLKSINPCQSVSDLGVPPPWILSSALRTEALEHFIFLNVGHVLAVCRQFVKHYNRARPSQALHAIRDPYPELTTPPKETGRVEARPVLGGLIHASRRRPGFVSQ